jgi:DNA polymerase elongation subunit (family B)
MSFISTYNDYRNRDSDILVWERNENGERVCKKYSPPFYFYVPDDEGDFKSMYGFNVKKVSFNTYQDFVIGKEFYPVKYESDFSPADKVLMDYYYKKPIPKLNYSFFDIETDSDELGFSKASEARTEITAITLYNQWEDTYYAIGVPPPEYQDGDFIPDISQFGYEKIENLEFVMVSTEIELLTIFLELIKDSDFISGWNSEFYDLVFIYQRIIKLMGEKATSNLCFPGAGLPKVGTREKFKKDEMVINLSGRIHMDYRDMFEKFTFEGRSSWALASICEEELKISKLEYEGSLKELYHNDFRTYMAYNIVDVYLLCKLDKKFRFVATTNQMAHENTVPLPAILGTTKYVDMGIRNYGFFELGLVSKDKEPAVKNQTVEGALVLTPKRGLWKWIGSIDINSLYPSIIRALGISPEKLIGQFNTVETIKRCMQLEETLDLQLEAKKKGHDLTSFFEAMSKESDWRGIKDKDKYIHRAELINGQILEKTGKEWNEFLREKKWAISAYGTIFDQSTGMGVLPQTLTFWYAERKKLQAEVTKWKEILEDLLKQHEK